MAERPSTMAVAVRRSSARSMFARVARMQATGSTLAPHAQDPHWRRSGSRAKMQTVADLPPDFVETLNREEAHEYERQMTFNGHRRAFAHMVREIYDILDSASQDKKQLRRIMHEIVQRVLDTSGLHPSLMSASPDAMADVVASERERFLRVGGAECLLRVIHTLRQEDQVFSSAAAGHGAAHRPALVVERDRRVRQQRSKAGCRDDMRTLWELPVPLQGERVKNRPDGAARKAILNDAMGVLRELCYFSPSLAYQLCDKDGLIVYLFQLMGEPKFFDGAAGLVEEILAVREESFDLSRIRTSRVVHLYAALSHTYALVCECAQPTSSRSCSRSRRASSRSSAASSRSWCLSRKTGGSSRTRVRALLSESLCPLTHTLTLSQLSLVCLSSPEIIKSLELLQLRRNRMMRADNVVDRNHAVLFNSPLVLQRLLVVLQVQNFYFALNPVYEPFSSELATSAEFAMLLSQTSDRSDWEMIDQLVTHPSLGDTGDLTLLHQSNSSNSSERARSESLGAESDASHRPRFSIETAILRDLIFRNRAPGQQAIEDVEALAIMKSLVLAPHRVEVLFVLCMLLNGKRKVDFQDRLAEMGLVKTLSTMFDKFEWTTTTPAPAHAPLHGPGCDCSLDASLKIQFLRLIHNFCDRDFADNSSKLLLLSASELERMRDGTSQPIDLSHPDKGLLCKIIDTLIRQPADSIYRFWLASCVEAFLRRSAPNEQLFVARTPLLQALVTEILSGGGYRSPGSFQSAFDLLGEMTKGNRETLQLFHRLLSNDQFESFMGASLAVSVYVRQVADSLSLSLSIVCRGRDPEPRRLERVHPVDVAVVREVRAGACARDVWPHGRRRHGPHERVPRRQCRAPLARPHDDRLARRRQPREHLLPQHCDRDPDLPAPAPAPPGDPRRAPDARGALGQSRLHLHQLPRPALVLDPVLHAARTRPPRARAVERRLVRRVEARGLAPVRGRRVVNCAPRGADAAAAVAVLAAVHGRARAAHGIERRSGR